MTSISNVGSAAALILGALLLAPAAARADCAADVAKISAAVNSVQDVRTKELLAFDVQRAKKELNEGDADECQEAMDHAKTLLAPPK